MPKLTTLPLEIRDMIYSLLLIKNTSISISSPRKKHEKKGRRRTHFASLLLVNKQVNAEASAVFFSRNTFIVGNGFWGSTNQANLHALKTFMKDVPKKNLALIRKLELDVTCDDKPSRRHHVRKEEIETLQALCRCIVKHFTGIREVLVAAIPIHWYARAWDRFLPYGDRLEGDPKDVAKALQMLLCLPVLKKIDFNIESACNIVLWADAVLEGKPEAKGKVNLWGVNPSLAKRRDRW